MPLKPEGSPAMTPERRQQLLAASRLGRAVLAGRPAGAAEFLYDPAKVQRDSHGRFASTAQQGGLTAEAAGSGDVLRARVQDTPAELRSASRRWSDDLPHDTKLQLAHYTTGENSRKVNDPLRASPDGSGLDRPTHQRAAAMDAAIRAFPAHPPLTSWRGVTADGARLDAIESAFKAAHASGGEVTLNGFTSSTLDPGLAASRGPVVLELRSPRGAYLGDASHYPEQAEILHAHGERFKVVGVEDGVSYGDTETAWTRKCRTYILEAVPEPPPPFPPAPPEPATTPPGIVGRVVGGVKRWLGNSATMSRDWDEKAIKRNKGRFAPKDGGGDGEAGGGAAADPMLLKPTLRDGIAATPRDRAILDLQNAHGREKYLTRRIGELGAVGSVGAKNQAADLGRELKKVQKDKATARKALDAFDAPPKAAKSTKTAAPKVAATPKATPKTAAPKGAAKTSVAKTPAVKKAATPKTPAAKAPAVKKTPAVKPVTAKPSTATPAPKAPKPKAPKAPAVPARPVAEVAADLKAVVDRHVVEVHKGNGQTGRAHGPGETDMVALKAHVQKAIDGCKTKADLAQLVGHYQGQEGDAGMMKWHARKTREELVKDVERATIGRVGQAMRTHL